MRNINILLFEYVEMNPDEILLNIIECAQLLCYNKIYFLKLQTKLPALKK